MGKLRSIPGITGHEVDKLKNAGYPTSDALWKKLAEDERGTLDALAAATGLSSARLTELLSAEVARNRRIVDGGFVGRHWLDLSVAASILLLLWALFVWHGSPAPPDNPVWVRLALKQLPADPNRKTPYPATLVVTPHTAGEPLVEEVTVIEVFPGQAPAATVAIGSGEVFKIGRLLGTSDLYLVQPPK
jgi:hypothetical protein